MRIWGSLPILSVAALCQEPLPRPGGCHRGSQGSPYNAGAGGDTAVPRSPSALTEQGMEESFGTSSPSTHLPRVELVGVGHKPRLWPHTRISQGSCEGLREVTGRQGAARRAQSSPWVAPSLAARCRGQPAQGQADIHAAQRGARQGQVHGRESGGGAAEHHQRHHHQSPGQEEAAGRGGQEQGRNTTAPGGG